MDIKKYEVLLNVIDRGSLVRACEDSGYTQSGITHMMNSLEQEVGFPILLRTNKGVQITPAGEQVLSAIRELVHMNERLEQEFDLIRGLETGKLRIGCYPTVACSWMPRLLRVFRERYPNIQIELIEEGSISRLEGWLSSGTIDVAFFSRQPRHAYEWVNLKKGPYLALMPEGHPLAGRAYVTPEELMEESFFMQRCLDGMDQDIRRYFEKNGVPIRSGITSNSDYTILFLVEQGLGVAVLPSLILEQLSESSRHLVSKPLCPPAYRELGFAVRSFRDSSPAMARFTQCVKEVLQQENEMK